MVDAGPSAQSVYLIGKGKQQKKLTYWFNISKVIMSSIINNMPKYDHRQHVLSDWLAVLDQRFQLGEVGEDKNKIT